MSTPREAGLPHRLGKVAEDLTAALRRLPAEDPPRSRSRPTVALRELIDSLCVKHGIGRSTPEQELRERWPDLVGPALASFSHPARLDPGGRLVVHVSHAVVRNELFLSRETILERVQAVAGCAGIRLVIFTTG